MSEEDVVVRDVPERHRYVISLDGADVGLSTYLDHEGHRVFLHTEVDPDYGGRGLAGELVRAALDDVRSRGERLVVLCPYITTFVGKNHDWDDLIDEASPQLLDRLRN